MTDLETAVKEWRDARQAFFDASGTGVANYKPEMWARLGNAEYALMQLAKKIP